MKLVIVEKKTLDKLTLLALFGGVIKLGKGKGREGGGSSLSQ